MGSVASKHFYRFTYLKSEHWRELRLSKLAEAGCKCARCGHFSWSNDIHHLRYRRLYDVKLSDLLVLCRSCHDKVHASIDVIREAIESGVPAAHAHWAGFLELWGENPARIKELRSVIRDMRKRKLVAVDLPGKKKKPKAGPEAQQPAPKNKTTRSSGKQLMHKSFQHSAIRQDRDIRNFFVALRKEGFYLTTEHVLS